MCKMQSEAHASCSPSPANFGAYLRLCFPFGCPCKHRAPAVCFVAEKPLKPVLGGGNVPPGVHVLPVFFTWCAISLPWPQLPLRASRQQARSHNVLCLPLLCAPSHLGQQKKGKTTPKWRYWLFLASLCSSGG